MQNEVKQYIPLGICCRDRQILKLKSRFAGSKLYKRQTLKKREQTREASQDSPLTSDRHFD